MATDVHMNLFQGNLFMCCDRSNGQNNSAAKGANDQFGGA